MRGKNVGDRLYRATLTAAALVLPLLLVTLLAELVVQKFQPAELPELETPLEEAHVLFTRADRVTQDLDLRVDRTEAEIGLRDVSLQRKNNRLI